MMLPDRITLALRAPEGATLEQVLPFALLGAHVSIGRGLAVIAAASQGDLVSPALEREEFDIDEHVRMAADARRYRWLRSRHCISSTSHDLLAARGLRPLSGNDLDRLIDHAQRQDQALLEEQP
ncbi:hypothetical protein [Pseudomonas oryziphila]|uniref:Uncharacterized protein n=1 Tax=Pseudomonas entomophila TaxID=312306 RepID=A0A3S8ULU0_9PSED|nr:hypothetical protein [Pseudomonas oryziphila]AZL69237.1 hypothetical protein EJA05_16550 [Pseudomonas oryziphila]